jgi:isopropylmalate/homocitrate/citramalate synthase
MSSLQSDQPPGADVTESSDAQGPSRQINVTQNVDRVTNGQVIGVQVGTVMGSLTVNETRVVNIAGVAIPLYLLLGVIGLTIAGVIVAWFSLVPAKMTAPFNVAVAEFGQTEANGAVRVGVTDTLGCATPEAISEYVARARKEVKVPVALHLHNDFGLATANAIAGVKAGASAVTTTVNGIGERAGNVPLEQFAVALKYLYGADIGIDCTKMKALSDYICQVSGLHKPRNQPLVGTNVFAHESGIHVAAILNCPLTYESIPPEAVGNERHIIMGKKTGVNYVKRRLEEMRVAATDQQAAEICKRIKQLGEQKGRVSNAEFNDIVDQVIPRA